ncbi:MAG: 4-hydroxythreonine-4-phosphate dehydrogenase PdxA, partial [Balneolaceae bacterium]
MTPVIAISMGDYNGIGPEIILKAFRQLALKETRPLVIGHERVLHFYNRQLGTGLNIKKIDPAELAAGGDDILHEEGTLYIINSSPDSEIEIHPGVLSPLAGKASMDAVRMGTNLCTSDKADALVTASISKEAIRMAGFSYPGHTEFLADLTGAASVQMILVSGDLRVALATIHIPLSEVSSVINRERIGNHLYLLDKSLKSDFGIKAPRIAVLGLNPHAGDGGVIGNEEQTIIRPSLEAAAEEHIHAEGPFAADGFFGNRTFEQFDAVLAMYHDQGLIPFKTLSFGSG